MAARKWSSGDMVGEFRDLGSSSSAMALDYSGCIVILASKRYFQFVNLVSPKDTQRNFRVPVKNIKWDVSVVQWNPSSRSSSTFIIARDQVADLFSFAEGKVENITSLQSHTRRISDLDWSPFDSNIILTCSPDFNTFLWDIRQSKRPQQIFETAQSASQVKWNKMKEHVLATSHDRDIRIWDVRKGNRALRSITGHVKKINSLDWSQHNGSLLSSACQDHIKFWDSDEAIPKAMKDYDIPTIKSPADSNFWKARFTPFVHGLLTIDISHGLRREGEHSPCLWNIENINAPTVQHTFVGHSDVVLEFQWRKEGTDQHQLVTWSRDQTLRLWKFESAVKVIDMMDPSEIRSSRLSSSQLPEMLTVSQTKNGSLVDQSDFDNSLSSQADALDQLDLDSGLADQQYGAVKFNKSEDSEGIIDDVARENLNNELNSRVNGRTAGDALLSRKKEVLPTSPVQMKALQNEFRYISKIDNVDLQHDYHQRKLAVTIHCGKKSEYKIKLQMSFPGNYPVGEAPRFQFDPSTNIEKSLQEKWIAEMEKTAIAKISKNKACIEPCIKILKKEVEQLENRKSPENDPALKASIISTSSPYPSIKDNSVPCPRTCGATFCNDILVTFQRPSHPLQEKAPRSMADMTRSRNSYFPAPPTARSPKEGSVMFYDRSLSLSRRTKNKSFKKEKSGTIFVYDISQLLPVSKRFAKEYNLSADSRSCQHNAEVALKGGRRDLYQVWTILGEIVSPELQSDPNNPDLGVPWARLPCGRSLVQAIIDNYARIGDLQTLAMICCLFPYVLPDADRPVTGQKSFSNLKALGTSPGAFDTGHSSPDKLLNPIEQASTEPTSNATQKTRQHSNSLAGSMRELRPFRNHCDVASELQRHKAALQMLDPDRALLYDFYKELYADQLHRWGYLEERAKLLKTMSHNQVDNKITITCPACNKSRECFACVQENKEKDCSNRFFKCAVCRLVVKGVATFCSNCGHGGHPHHLRTWFTLESTCPTGCGCDCLPLNTLEV